MGRLWDIGQVINDEYRRRIGRGLLEDAFTMDFVFSVFREAVEYLVLNKIDSIEHYDTKLSNALKYFIESGKYQLYPRFPKSRSAIEAFHDAIEIMKSPVGFFANYESRYRAFIDSLKSKLLQA
jgi:hypothetical protein